LTLQELLYQLMEVDPHIMEYRRQLKVFTASVAFGAMLVHGRSGSLTEVDVEKCVVMLGHAAAVLDVSIDQGFGPDSPEDMRPGVEEMVRMMLADARELEVLTGIPGDSAGRLISCAHRERVLIEDKYLHDYGNVTLDFGIRNKGYKAVYDKWNWSRSPCSSADPPTSPPAWYHPVDSGYETSYKSDGDGESSSYSSGTKTESAYEGDTVMSEGGADDWPG
jgi:hypothetical protein